MTDEPYCGQPIQPTVAGHDFWLKRDRARHKAAMERLKMERAEGGSLGADWEANVDVKAAQVARDFQRRMEWEHRRADLIAGLVSK